MKMKRMAVIATVVCALAGLTQAASITWGTSTSGYVFDGTEATDWMTGGFVYLVYVGQVGETSLPDVGSYASGWGSGFEVADSGAAATWGEAGATSQITPNFTEGTWEDARFVFFATTQSGLSGTTLPSDSNEFYGMSSEMALTSYNTGANSGEVYFTQDLYATQPVPEPGTILLGLVGAGALLARRRKSKKA